MNDGDEEIYAYLVYRVHTWEHSRVKVSFNTSLHREHGSSMAASMQFVILNVEKNSSLQGWISERREKDTGGESCTVSTIPSL